MRVHSSTPRRRKTRALSAAAAVAVATVGGVLVAPPASAVPGDAGAYGAYASVTAQIGSIIDFSFAGSAGGVSVTLPGAESDSQSGSSFFDNALGDYSLGATQTSAESTIALSQSAATVSGGSFDLLGQNLVAFGPTTASTRCIHGQNAEAAVTSAGLSILGSPVTIDPEGPVSRTVTLGNAVRYTADPAVTADLSGLQLTVAVLRILQETATDGVAISLVVTATLDGTFETQEFHDELVASTIVAGASCEPPPAPAPLVASEISPASGPLAGGQTVTITGSGFTSDTTVTFGANPASGVVVDSSGTSLTAVTPAAAASGPTTVTISRGADGTSASLGYTYLAPLPPVVASTISPASGPLGGGQSVTITGSGFTPDTTVAFGTAPATDVVVSSATSLTAVTPAGGAAGATPVTITRGADGTSASLVYTYIAPPPPPVVALTISPSSGPQAGGQTVTITGSGFTDETIVVFGETLATGVVIDPSGTSLTAIVPAAERPGEVTVFVEREDGDCDILEYTYLAATPEPPTPDPPTPGPSTPPIPYLPPTGEPAPSAVAGISRNAPAATAASTTLAATGSEIGFAPFLGLTAIGTGALALLATMRRRRAEAKHRRG